MRPTIAVTTSRRSGWRIFPLVALNVWLGGGAARRWGTGRPADLDDVDGLIIGGGDDISPHLYNGTVTASARLDPNRDALELRLAQAALQRGVPVLGICRGAQMINIALGGSLHRNVADIYIDHDGIRTILPQRRVDVLPDTHLARHAGTAPMTVNALHSQSVDRLGRGLRVSALAANGMVQAIESTRDPFALGVQWHPEHLFYARRQRRIFAALTTAARAHRNDLDQTRHLQAKA